jgi:uncharacterized protein with ATP-grasp and redox domains
LKVEIECASCIIHRGCLETQEATKDSALQFKAISALLEFLNREFNPNAVPAYLGTERDRIIKRVTGNRDPYKERKRISNQKALETLPFAQRIVLEEKKSAARFRKACLCSIVGNIIEFDIPDHSFEFDELRQLIQNAEKDLAIDDIPKIFDLAQKSKGILFLTDNAGEIVFDTLLIQELKKLGAHVIVAVKGDAVLNDATMEDAKLVGMHEIADKIITTGTDVVGLCLQKCSKEFLKFYEEADFVIAKGMGYAETLTETSLKQPHALLMRTKCHPVANYFGVKIGKNVAKLLG